MIIDCYVFSDIALEPNHTYYNIENYKLLLYYLKDYHVDSFSTFTFIYKIKVNSEDVHYLGKYGLYALKYQVVEEVPFRDFVTELSLPSLTKAEIMSIIKGTSPEHKVIKKYEELLTLNKKYYPLSSIYTLKLHAILSQKKYKLPIFYVDEQRDTSLVRVFEYYNREYDIRENALSIYVSQKAKREKLLGSKNFEKCFINQEFVVLSAAKLSFFCDLIKSRKITQNTFEVFCEGFMNILDDNDKKYLVERAIFANYEIPNKYKDVFLPEAVFKYPDWIKDLKTEHLSLSCKYDDYVTRFLTIGYKVENGNYNSEWANSIKKTRSILKNDNYKYIKI